jgi:hypothetical protein
MSRQFHPIYFRSEYEEYQERERRDRRAAIWWGLFTLGCAAGIVWLLS